MATATKPAPKLEAPQPGKCRRVINGKRHMAPVPTDHPNWTWCAAPQWMQRNVTTSTIRIPRMGASVECEQPGMSEAMPSPCKESHGLYGLMPARVDLRAGTASPSSSLGFWPSEPIAQPVALTVTHPAAEV